MDKNYIIEKLTNAMESLTLGPGDIRSRLITAHQCMFTLREDDFPSYLPAEWSWIKRQLTKYGPVVGPNGQFRDSVENTMRKVRNQTGVRIAERISKLYWSLSNNKKYS